MPIQKLTSTTITQICAGPCGLTNDIPHNSVMLGKSMTAALVVDCIAGKLYIWPKASGKSVIIADPGMAATLGSAEAGNVITVTLGHDGTNTISTIENVSAEINTRTTVKDRLYALALGNTSTVCVPVAQTSLTLSGTAFNKNQIGLPTCPNCNSIETLNRTWDTINPALIGTLQDRRRRAVNFLGKKLKELGQMNPFAKTAIVTETPANPPDILADYPSGDGSI